LREQSAAGVIAVFAFYAYQSERPSEALVNIALGLAVAWSVWGVGRLGSTPTRPLASEGSAAFLAHYGDNLRKQIRLTRRAWWFVLPLTLAAYAWLYERGVAFVAAGREDKIGSLLVVAAAGTAFNAAIVWWNLRAARRMQQQLDEIESLSHDLTGEGG
jgi:hypothetical protein